MKASDFTRWTAWPDRADVQHGELPGVYILARTKEHLAGRRFGWVEDIVYIRMTNAKGGLRSRLRQFDDTIAGKRVTHGGADRVRFEYRHYGRLIPNLYVAVTPVECDVESLAPWDLLRMGDVAKLEYECLAAYVRRFGRLPRFNDKPYAKKYSLTVGREK